MYSYTECLSYLLYVVIVYLQSDFPRPKCSSLTYTSSVTTVAQRTRPTFGRQNHSQRYSSILFSSLNTCLPNPPLPFTSSVPQENVFHCSFNASESLPMPFFLCFSEDLLCILQNPSQMYFYEAFPSSPRQSCMLSLLVHGESVSHAQILALKAFCCILEVSVYITGLEMNCPRCNRCSTYLCIPRAQHRD